MFPKIIEDFLFFLSDKYTEKVACLSDSDADADYCDELNGSPSDADSDFEIKSDRNKKKGKTKIRSIVKCKADKIVKGKVYLLPKCEM